jgi:hypothetical protein
MLPEPSRRLQRLVVLVVFGATGSLRLLRDVLYPHHIGIDGRIYTDASRIWLSGGDPWTTTYEFGIRYAAPPPSLLATAPLTVLSPAMAGSASVAISLVLALAAIRSLGLPIWWILWSPILDGVLVGSLDIATMALLVIGAGRACGVAPLLKVYAVLPMLGERRWRGLLVAVGLTVATAPILPWRMFLSDLSVVGNALVTQTMSGSVWGDPVLMVAFAVILLSLGAARAGYLAVPIFWPRTQPHYSALVLPVAAQSTILAVGFAFAFLMPWVPALAVAVYAVVTFLRRRTEGGDHPTAVGGDA